MQLALFALAFLSEAGRGYVAQTRAELVRRADALFGPLGIPPAGGSDTDYYAVVDVLQLARVRHGDDFVEWLVAHVDPDSVPLRLAAEHGVILQSGASFQSEPWDLRVSMASLGAAAHEQIAIALLAVIDAMAADR